MRSSLKTLVEGKEDSPLLLHELLGDHILGEVGILILVDEEVVDTLLPLLEDLGMLTEEDIDL